ncbi:MAG: 4Fe-4S dicluster domain-containing protein [Actinomycetia bacterium]|nr:4Fe-4S dicluster domain-containing protein [Actinomycetes bacterium]
MKTLFVDHSICLSCESCALACAVAHSQSKTLYGAIAEEFPPRARVHVEAVGGGGFPLQCRHCDDPQCVKACVAKALYVDAVSGTVQHDDSRCIGCTMCILACPFGAIEEQPAADNNCAISKCDLCQGLDGEPACVSACPTAAISFKEPDTYSKNKRQAYLVELTSVGSAQ